MMKEVFEAALTGRAYEYGVIPTSALHFSRELYQACESNVCGNYNQSWSCPPAIGTLDEQSLKIKAYKQAMVFTTKYDLEDSFDFEGMMKAKDIHDLLTTEMHDQFGGSNPVYGAGGCRVCKKCAYPEPCRYPERVYSAIEAAGINVTDLSRAASIKYNNGENTVTYFSMILFND
jgi:predicted metal-binding protein